MPMTQRPPTPVQGVSGLPFLQRSAGRLEQSLTLAARSCERTHCCHRRRSSSRLGMPVRLRDTTTTIKRAPFSSTWPGCAVAVPPPRPLTLPSAAWDAGPRRCCCTSDPWTLSVNRTQTPAQGPVRVSRPLLCRHEHVAHFVSQHHKPPSVTEKASKRATSWPSSPFASSYTAIAFCVPCSHLNPSHLQIAQSTSIRDLAVRGRAMPLWALRLHVLRYRAEV
ncbi:uncharacterized protein J3D65DRAFT_615639 [Phyllosticta citribraziliensis]|uniref:Uncharacterized protein n=1 Tax=Phyllosticta citribraziliensis TaxID=989973 RepID=A0ABR1M1A1_9PEZI